MTTKHNKEFKEQAVKKALERRPEESLKSIAKDLNIGFSTLTKWIAEYKQNKGLDLPAAEKRPVDWSLAEKLEALLASGTLQDAELQSFCRQRGIFAHHLQEWKKEFLQCNTEQMKKSTENKLKQEVQRLSREISRKDKVIAETTALLVLGKKMSAFWEEKKGY